MRKFLILVLLLLVLLGSSFSESATKWTKESVKDWLYTVTPDQLVSELVELKNLQTETPVVTFPLNSFFLTEKGTLVSKWDTPMKIKIGGRLEYNITMDQVEILNFYKAPKPSIPWGWVGAGTLGVFVLGLVTGVVIN